MDGVAERLTAFRAEVARILSECGRDPDGVRIVPASKTVPPETLSVLPRLGITEVGENRAAELVGKAALLPALKWHFFGQLQTNKVKYIIDKVVLVHSLDRTALAETLERQAEKIGRGALGVLIEINSARDPVRGGIPPEAAKAFAKQVVSYPHLRLEGVMTVLPREGAETAARETQLASLAVREVRAEAAEISMGMSEDYAIALRYGATILRPGRAIFGARGGYNG